jgi:RNA polymerase sigma-70 factor (ECF subfamily)
VKTNREKTARNTGAAHISKHMPERPGRSTQSANAAPIGEGARLTQAEFAARFQAAWPTLWCVAAAVLGDRVGADDVLQEAALVALGKLSQFDPNTNFTAWMGRIVRYIALNHARRRIKTTTASIDPSSMEIAAHDVNVRSDQPILNGRGELSVGQQSFDDRVLAALGSLDETARACLLLRTVLDMPYREISRALDIAEGTAMSHVHRARTALRQRLRLDAVPADSDHAHPTHGHE